jgi:hypothetical protein
MKQVTGPSKKQQRNSTRKRSVAVNAALTDPRDPAREGPIARTVAALSLASSGIICPVRAALRSIEFVPDPLSLSGDASGFAFAARLIIGPDDAPGDESFDVTVCSPEWLAERSRNEGIIDGRHHAVVNVDAFDERDLRKWLEQRVASVEAPTWPEVAARLARFAYWELEDYRA